MQSSDHCASIFVLAPPLVRWGLERLLRSAGVQLSIAGASCHLAEASVQLQALYPDAVVVDLDHYAGDDLQHLQGNCGSVIGLVSGDKTADAAHRTPQGVAACVHTRTPPAAFVRTVLQLISATRAANPAGWPQRVPDTQNTEVRPVPASKTAGWQPEALTPKQREIVRAVTLHASAPAKVIAAKLHISEHTLRNHLSEIYSRLGVTRRTHLQAIVAGEASAFGTDARVSMTGVQSRSSRSTEAAFGFRSLEPR